jgi:hypothetical protein
MGGRKLSDALQQHMILMGCVAGFTAGFSSPLIHSLVAAIPIGRAKSLNEDFHCLFFRLP